MKKLLTIGLAGDGMLKNLLTIGLAGVALLAGLAMAAARDVLAPAEILATVRSMGLGPTGALHRRGPFYVLHAYDARGLELRVVADAQFGDIVSITPARELVNFYVPGYVRGPRIIHVPQFGATDDDDIAPLRGHVTPRPQHRSETPTSRSGNSPSLFDGPTPIRPTPRYKVKVDSDAGNAPSVPPSGGN
ncbi:MAG: hypothetical protein ACREB2_12435 [Pseudolabrys sp.]